MHISDLFHVDEVNQLLVAGVLVLRQFAPLFFRKSALGKLNGFLGSFAYSIELGLVGSGKLTSNKTCKLWGTQKSEDGWHPSIVYQLLVYEYGWIWPVWLFFSHMFQHLRQPSTQLLQNAAMLPCSQILFLKWIVKQVSIWMMPCTWIGTARCWVKLETPSDHFWEG